MAHRFREFHKVFSIGLLFILVASTISMATSIGDSDKEFSEHINNVMPFDSDLYSLSAPTNLSFSCWTDYLRLSWDAVGGAVSYKVYAAYDSTQMGDEIPNRFSANNNHQIPKVPGLTRYYRVTALDSEGTESGYSDAIETYCANLPESDPVIEIPDFASGNVTTTHISDMDFVDFDFDGILELSIIGDTPTDSIGYFNIYEYEYGTEFTFDTTLARLDHGDADWGDYDNDGDLDIAVVGYDEIGEEYIATVFRNNGSGGFEEVSAIGSVLYTSTYPKIRWADIDNDGDQDIFIVDAVSGKLFINEGNDVFTEEFFLAFVGNDQITGLEDGDIEILDINGDGYLDITLAGKITNYDDDTAILINPKDNSFYFNDNTTNLVEYIFASIDWGDFDADGDPDLAIMGSQDNVTIIPETTIYTNDGSGTFTHFQTIKGYINGDIKFVDFDMDGLLDLSMSGFTALNDTSTAGFTIFWNDGSEFIELDTPEFEGLGKGNIKWVNFYQSGRPDLVINGINGEGYQTKTYNFYNSPYDPDVPDVPTNLNAYINGNNLTVSWDVNQNWIPQDLYEGTGTRPGALSHDVLIVNAESELVSTSSIRSYQQYGSYLYEAFSRGNVGTNTFAVYNFSNWEPGTYTVYVNSISGYGTSPNSASIEIPIKDYFTSQNVVALEDTSYFIPKNTFNKNSFLNDSSLTFSLVNENDITFIAAGDSIKIDADTSGIKDVNLRIATSTGSIVDTLSIQVAISESQPTIPGISGEGGWYLISNPLQAPLGTLLSEIWTQGAINGDTESGAPNIYTFNPDSANFIPVSTNLDTTTTSAGEGILVYIFADDNYEDEMPPINGGWPKSLLNKGNPFGENVSVPVKNTDVNNDGFTSGNEGYILLGNPYGFPLSIDSVIAKMVDVDPIANQYIYRWDPTNKQYTLSSDGFVEAYESFFVRIVQSGASGNISFTYNDAHSSARLKQVKHASLDFTLSSNLLTPSSFSVRVGSEGKTGLDPKDGFYLGTLASEYSNLYTEVDDYSLVINNLPSDLSEEKEIPLFLHSTEQNEHKLEWSSNSLPEGWVLELVDPKSEMVVNVREESSYSFQSEGVSLKRKGNELLGLFGDGNYRSKQNGNSKMEEVLILRIKPGKATHSENDLGIPTQVELEQNYPNPFNPSSVIRFGVPQQATVQLEVFDVVGRKVMTLLDGEVKQPGRYNISFNARDLASGMYIYRLVIGNNVLTKKMTLIK